MVRIDCFIIILNQVGVVVVKSCLVQIKKKLKCYVLCQITILACTPKRTHVVQHAAAAAAAAAFVAQKSGAMVAQKECVVWLVAPV